MRRRVFVWGKKIDECKADNASHNQHIRHVEHACPQRPDSDIQEIRHASIVECPIKQITETTPEKTGEQHSFLKPESGRERNHKAQTSEHHARDYKKDPETRGF